MSKGFRAHEYVIPLIFGHQTITSASYAVSASYADYAAVAGTAETASHAIYAESAGSAITASFAFSASNADYAVSASYSETSSYATTALSASHAITSITSSYSTTAISASYASTSSYSVTSSYALSWDETLDIYDGGSGSYTTLDIHKYGLVQLAPSASVTYVYLDNTDYNAEDYVTIENETGNTLEFSGSNGVKVYSEGATAAGNDGKLKNTKSYTTVTCIYDGTRWDLIGKLSS